MIQLTSTPGKPLAVAIIKDWHNPGNMSCEQNHDVDADCTCPRPPRKRKPFKVVRVCDPTVPHNVNENIVIEIHPGGRICLREKRRKHGLWTTVGNIYAGLVWREAMAAARVAKANRKARKAGRK